MLSVDWELLAWCDDPPPHRLFLHVEAIHRQHRTGRTMTNTTPATTSTSRSTKNVTATTDSLNADTTHGTTTVEDSVVAKIAGIAAREVPGVHDLGGGAARALGAIRNRINQADQGQGISVEVGETQAAVDVIVVAEYPIPLHHVADGIRTAVTTAIETLVGLEVTEVNVTIADVHIPSDDDTDGTADVARVQ
jgi:uncharacterized alkaline shock family protein YloU